MPFQRAQKTLKFQCPTPSHFPNRYHILNIMQGLNKSCVHRLFHAHQPPGDFNGVLITELVKIEAKQTLLILPLRKIEAKRILFIPQFKRSKRSEVCLFHKLERSKRNEVCLFHKFERSKRSELCLFHKLERSKRSLFIQELKKIEAKRTQLIPEIGKIEAKNRTGSKFVFVLHVMEPKNWFQGTNSASQCGLSPYLWCCYITVDPGTPAP
jgi:hypothetical protein